MRTMPRTLAAIIAIGFSLTSITGAAGQSLPKGRERRLLYQDDFSVARPQWVVEQSKGKPRIVDGQLDINTAGGCTMWFKKRLSAPVLIEYEATPVKSGGRHDRVSDLNCFWMAIDPEHPRNIFAKTRTRTGDFSKYHSFRLYYVGYGGNNNTTTRFRRYPGDGSRPLLPRHDLKDKKFLLKPNKTLKIQIVSAGKRQQYIRDGKVVFGFTDDKPFLKGWFGFRTVRSHLRIDNFKIYALGNAN